MASFVFLCLTLTEFISFPTETNPQKKIGCFLHLRLAGTARSLMCCNLDCITRALKRYFRIIAASTSARTPRAPHT